MLLTGWNTQESELAQEISTLSSHYRDISVPFELKRKKRLPVPQKLHFPGCFKKPLMTVMLPAWFVPCISSSKCITALDGLTGCRRMLRLLCPWKSSLSQLSKTPVSLATDVSYLS